jgi:hypothetical protein
VPVDQLRLLAPERVRLLDGTAMEFLVGGHFYTPDIVCL